MFKNPFNEFVKAVKSNNLTDVAKKFKPEFLNKQDNDGYYPIHLACLNNSVDIFKFFLKQNCDIELLDSNRNRPIHCAIKTGSVEIVKLLLGYRCSIDDGNELMELAKTKPTNRGYIIEILEKAIENRQIGIEMDLECRFDCDHKFCLISFMMIEFDKSEVIGCGVFGKVYKVVESIGKRVFAFKKVSWKDVEIDNSPEKENNLGTIKKDAKWLENNINEYKIMLSHPHIIKYFGAIKEDYKLLIFMEFAENGTIFELIENHFQDGLPYDKIIKYSQHILLALDYLHEKNILHRDIKSANILLDKADNCKLTDLGYSRLLDSIHQSKSIDKKQNSENQKGNKTENQAKTYCGTANYMAPEIINGMPYSFPCDLWSLGGTVIEMLTGKPPYYGTPQNEIIYKIGIGIKYDYVSFQTTKDKPSKPPENLRNFIDQLLSTDPKNRKTAAYLLTLNLFNI